MDFEWNGEKAAFNLRKHGIDFADAVTLFDDESTITIQDEAVSGKRRFISIGMDALGRVLVVVYVWRKDRIRLISARKATRRERRQHEGSV